MSEWIEEIRSKNQPQDAAFKIKLGAFDLYITKGHIYYPDEWIMHLGPGHLADTLPLNLSGDTAVYLVKDTALGVAIGLMNKQIKLLTAGKNIAIGTLETGKQDKQ